MGFQHYQPERSFKRFLTSVALSRESRLRLGILLLLIFTVVWKGASSGLFQSVWAAPDSEWGRLQQAMKILKRSTSGQVLLAEASRALGLRMEQWEAKEKDSPVSKVLIPSDLSRTDSTLTRVIHPTTGVETLKRETRVAIRVDQPLEDVVLDLAHELTHAARSQPIDPYDPDLTAEKYIILSLRGPGGEVEAVEMECRVGLELAKAFSLEMKRCRSYGDIDQNSLPIRMNMEKILAAFGALGERYSELQARLGDEVVRRHRWLSSQSPELVSSTGNAPYPLALLEEYESLTEAACRNSRKRIQFLQDTIQKSAAAPIRSPLWKRTEELLKKRCDR